MISYVTRDLIVLHWLSCRMTSYTTGLGVRGTVAGSTSRNDILPHQATLPGPAWLLPQLIAERHRLGGTLACNRGTASTVELTGSLHSAGLSLLRMSKISQFRWAYQNIEASSHGGRDGGL